MARRSRPNDAAFRLIEMMFSGQQEPEPEVVPFKSRTVILIMILCAAAVFLFALAAKTVPY